MSVFFFFLITVTLQQLKCGVFVCDAATCATTRWPRCLPWQTCTLAAKSWCLRRAPAWSWAPSWRGWGVRQQQPCELFFPFDLQQQSFFPFSVTSALFFCNCPPFAPCAGYGSVIQMYPGEGPARAGMESFGFPAHFHDTLHDFPICRVNALLAGTLDTAAKSLSAGRVRLFFYSLFLNCFLLVPHCPPQPQKFWSIVKKKKGKN